MLTADRLAEIRERHMGGDYTTDAVVHGHVADLLAEVDRLRTGVDALQEGLDATTVMLDECHALLRSFIRAAPLGARNAINNLLRSHGRST